MANASTSFEASVRLVDRKFVLVPPKPSGNSAEPPQRTSLGDAGYSRPLWLQGQFEKTQKITDGERAKSCFLRTPQCDDGLEMLPDRAKPFLVSVVWL
jgi:hypothetical protein